MIMIKISIVFSNPVLPGPLTIERTIPLLLSHFALVSAWVWGSNYL